MVAVPGNSDAAAPQHVVGTMGAITGDDVVGMVRWYLEGFANRVQQIQYAGVDWGDLSGAVITKDVVNLRKGIVQVMPIPAIGNRQGFLRVEIEK
jgi:hypothetical protein